MQTRFVLTALAGLMLSLAAHAQGWASRPVRTGRISAQ